MLTTSFFIFWVGTMNISALTEISILEFCGKTFGQVIHLNIKG